MGVDVHTHLLVRKHGGSCMGKERWQPVVEKEVNVSLSYVR